MSSQQRAELLKVLEKLLDLPPKQRSSRLRRLNLSEVQRRRIERWLKTESVAAEFLEGQARVDDEPGSDRKER